MFYTNKRNKTAANCFLTGFLPMFSLPMQHVAGMLQRATNNAGTDVICRIKKEEVRYV
ncbi:hypothetical protein [Brenneria izbisi]|uniref:Uncharacterized protein n=1 Tax=Brenneria izbisi TaxID=2939450 RepID=A0AA41XWQ2_9GAMM|nr:hypothetical protein [Brenneria izbisi]MCV9878310.1 hypothetical protein [Brenneria izbisi]MCV9881733.1 hypothetical protein [Brenneria izbisi]